MARRPLRSVPTTGGPPGQGARKLTAAAVATTTVHMRVSFTECLLRGRWQSRGCAGVCVVMILQDGDSVPVAEYWRVLRAARP